MNTPPVFGVWRQKADAGSERISTALFHELHSTPPREALIVLEVMVIKSPR